MRRPRRVLVSLSKGTDKDFGREFRGLAQGLIGQFKREGGKFKHPSRFHRVHAGPYIQGDVIAFRPKPAEQPMSAYDLYWTRFYAALLGIDIEEQPVEIEKHQGDRTAEITVLEPSRKKRDRRYA